MVVDSLAEFFQQNEEFVDNTIPHLEGDDLFSIFESLESVAEFTMIEDDVEPAKDGQEITTSLVFSETELETSPKTKRLKTTAVATSPTAAMAGLYSSEEPNPDGPQRISHITVERNRRKQMNEHLTVLRSLMPCFYVKKGDQASIIGGVVEYIKELQQVLQSLEAKKQRKVYSEVLSPRVVVSSPRPPNLPMSPRKPPLSPRLINLPISPRTPQPTSPYSKPPRLQQPPSAVAVAAAATATATAGYNISSSNSCTNSLEPSPCNSSSTTNSSIENNNNDLVANSKSAMAEVEVKFIGPNVVLKTVSPPIPGQAVKIISALEQLSLEILHVKITTLDETMFNSFTIKIGIECQLSAEELAHQIQQTFC